MMPPFETTSNSAGKATRKLDPDAEMRRLEPGFQRGVMRALTTLRRRLVADVGEDATVILSRLNDSEFTRPFHDAIVRELQTAAEAGAEFGREQIETMVFGTGKAATVEVGMWELANNAAAQWALQYGYELVRQLLETTRDRLQVEIAEYIRNSETMGELTARIQAGSGFSEQRARRIAVTEVTRAFARGSLESWLASGVTEGKRWNTNNDELVCPTCGPLNRQAVAIDAEFDGGLMSPPAHVNCRCWITPVPKLSRG